jgi:alkylhydroperoxidase/carboxymuconolactone decarboxylase family protein YurZ
LLCWQHSQIVHFKRALETHIRKAMAAGVDEAEIKHTLLLLIPTAGFPVSDDSN